ncbi:hypothetical protein NFI96_001365 [Prochilodus magdalenae]|nr:hypothetical protein NFI96_001365 [Prochilodus magdalenae]
MVRGGFSLEGCTALHVLARGSLTAIRYRDEILRPLVRPYAGAVGPGFLQMQDNARPHVAGVCQQFLQDEGVEAMEWPVRSPDLNPIEHIWDIMSCFIHQQTVQELADALVQFWEEIPQETTRHLIRSMHQTYNIAVSTNLIFCLFAEFIILLFKINTNIKSARTFANKHAHHLKLNPSKTELLFIPSTTGPHCDLAISFGNSLIAPTEDARSLGVILDGQLSFSAHIANLTRSCRFLLYNIRRIRPFLSQEATQLLVQSLVISRLDYCNSLLAGLLLPSGPCNLFRTLQLVSSSTFQSSPTSLHCCAPFIGFLLLPASDLKP